MARVIKSPRKKEKNNGLVLQKVPSLTWLGRNQCSTHQVALALSFLQALVLGIPGFKLQGSSRPAANQGPCYCTPPLPVVRC